MELLRQVIRVEAVDDKVIHVVFDTGESGKFDVSPLFHYPCYRRLNNPVYFHRVKAERGTAVWPEDEDLSPELLWENLVNNSFA